MLLHHHRELAPPSLVSWSLNHSLLRRLSLLHGQVDDLTVTLQTPNKLSLVFLRLPCSIFDHDTKAVSGKSGAEGSVTPRPHVRSSPPHWSYATTQSGKGEEESRARSSARSGEAEIGIACPSPARPSVCPSVRPKGSPRADAGLSKNSPERREREERGRPSRLCSCPCFFPAASVVVVVRSSARSRSH